MAYELQCTYDLEKITRFENTLTPSPLDFFLPSMLSSLGASLLFLTFSCACFGCSSSAEIWKTFESTSPFFAICTIADVSFAFFSAVAVVSASIFLFKLRGSMGRNKSSLRPACSLGHWSYGTQTQSPEYPAEKSFLKSLPLLFP